MVHIRHARSRASPQHRVFPYFLSESRWLRRQTPADLGLGTGYQAPSGAARRSPGGVGLTSCRWAGRSRNTSSNPHGAGWPQRTVRPPASGGRARRRGGGAQTAPRRPPRLAPRWPTAPGCGATPGARGHRSGRRAAAGVAGRAVAVGPPARSGRSTARPTSLAPDRAWWTERRLCRPSSPDDRIRERSPRPPPRHARDQPSHSLLREEVRIVRRPQNRAPESRRGRRDNPSSGCAGICMRDELEDTRNRVLRHNQRYLMEHDAERVGYKNSISRPAEVVGN